MLEDLLIIPGIFIFAFEIIISLIFTNIITVSLFIIILIFANINSNNKDSIVYSFCLILTMFINSIFFKGMLPQDGLYGGGNIISLLILFITAVLIIFFVLKTVNTIFEPKKSETDSPENVEKEEIKKEIETTPEQLDNLRHMATDIINETEHTIRGQKKKRR